MVKKLERKKRKKTSNKRKKIEPLNIEIRTKIIHRIF